MTVSTSAGPARAPLWRDAGIAFTGFGHHFGSQTIHNPPDARVTSSPVEDRVIGAVGVRRRHRAADDETHVHLAIEAARKAVADARVDPAELDLVIASHWTDRTYRDDTGALVAAALGARRVNAFEVSGACAGFVHAVHTAAMFLHGPAGHRKALVVSTERFTRRVRPGSKGELVVSDGAGAAVLEAGVAGPGEGLIDSVFYSDGNLAHMSAAYPPHGWVKSHPDLNDVAVDYVVATVRELLDRNGLSSDDLDWLVPHSGTEPFAKGVCSRTGVDPARVLTNLRDRGNVSSASIPTTVSELLRTGPLKRGDLVLSPSIGGGVWCWGGLLYRL